MKDQTARSAAAPTTAWRAALFENARDMVLLFDDQGIIRDANPAAEIAYGRPRAELLGMHVVSVRAPETVGTVPAVMAEALSRGCVFETRHIRADGTTFPVEVSTQPIEIDGRRMILSIIRDETRRHQEERLRTSLEERLRSLVERSPDGMALLRAGRVSVANPALSALLGRPVEGLTQAELLELFHLEDRSWLEARWSASAAGRVEPPTESRVVLPDGAVRQVDVLSYAAQPGELIVVARDASERRQMQTRLLQASRLASVGTLAAGVAHEINNPLAYVDSNLSFLHTLWPRLDERLRPILGADPAAPSPAGPRGGARSGDRQQPVPLTAALLDEFVSALDEAAHGVERVRNIVSDLKAFARAETDARLPVDVRAVLDQSLRVVQPEIKHRARVVRELSAVPPVEANESRLSQVFLNLLVNAAQAMPEGHPDHHELRVRTSELDGWVCIDVEDTGSGIQPEHLPHLFEPFFTTKPVGVGTGLGLSICHGIVTSLGGEIDVDSTLGQGTRFRVRLPAAR